MLQKIYKFFSQKGQGIVEYALLLGFVAIVTVGIFGDTGLKETFRDALKEAIDHLVGNDPSTGD